MVELRGAGLTLTPVAIVVEYRGTLSSVVFRSGKPILLKLLLPDVSENELADARTHCIGWQDNRQTLIDGQFFLN